MLKLYGNATVVVMEEGEMKGRCARETEETRRLYMAMSEGNWWDRRKAKKAFDKRMEEKRGCRRDALGRV